MRRRARALSPPDPPKSTDESPEQVITASTGPAGLTATTPPTPPHTRQKPQTSRDLVLRRSSSGLRALHSGDGRPFADGSNGGAEGPGSLSEPGPAGTRAGTPSEAEVKAELREVSLRLSRLEESLDRVLAVLEAGVGRGSAGEAPADGGRGAPGETGAGTFSGVAGDGGAAADAADAAALDPSPSSHSPREGPPEASMQPGGQPGENSEPSGSGFDAEEAILGGEPRDGLAEENGDSDSSRGPCGSEDAVGVGPEGSAPSVGGLDKA